MGVQGLWTLLEPAGRTTKLESMRRKRVGIDASIWLHQFMHTMRDSEGDPVRNGHLLGFFRRLNKLLFYDIKPVFVFDGGTPSLKKNTIRSRRERKATSKNRLKAVASKIFKARAKFRVVMEAKKKLHGSVAPEDEQIIYQEELEKTTQELNKSKKQDPYELPQVQSNQDKNSDPRLATREELQAFINEFETSDLDIDSEVFKSLPTDLQYELIQDLKVKSRQTSWSRLEEMVHGSKTALDFSKRQIESLTHRNTMTQRLMQMNKDTSGTENLDSTRIAGERGRQYVLYKNENVNQGLGWSLPGTTIEEPVVLDPNRPEPKLEVPREHASPLTNAKDSVRAAIESNPKLAALASKLLDVGSDEDYDDDYDHEDLSDQELEPISYTEEEVLYSNDQEESQFINNNEEEEVLNSNDGSTDYDEESFDITEEEITDTIECIDQELLGLANHQNPNYNQQARTQQFINYDDENQQPELFEENTKEPELKDDIRAYIDDNEPLSSVLARVYENGVDPVLCDVRFEPSSSKDTNEPISSQYNEDNSSVSSFESDKTDSIIDNDNDYAENSPELDFALDDFYQYWVSHIPDSFKSFYGENYLDIFKTAVEEDDVDILRDDLHYLKKLYGKTKTTEKEQLESYRYHIYFLKSMIGWYIKNFHKQYQDQYEVSPVNSVLSYYENSPIISQDDELQSLASLEQNIILTDDEEDESNIEFIDTPNDLNTKNNEEYLSRNEDNQRVRLNLLDSLLKPQEELSTESKVEYSTNVNTNIINDTEPTDLNLDDISQIPNDQNTNKDFDSEDELMEDAMQEEEEYARFVSDIASKPLENIRQELYQDMDELNKQKKKDMGNSDTISSQVIQDIQEMLRLFGVPYIVSPMEAEAQCAVLESLSLTDGTITDDSDAFLFGASRVYKNMFNQQKYVECYQTTDIERSMALNRNRLIQLAFLLGSDYTEGIPGVGPVMAMEILSEFSTSEDEPLDAPLRKFKEWYNGSIDDSSFKKKFRKKFNDLELSDDFPSPLVIEAYLNPVVDNSTQKFEWGQPQLDLLRTFLADSFGWSETKTDQLIVPVLREMNSKKDMNQQPVDSYFNTDSSLSTRQHSSKRVRNVVDGWKSQKKQKSNNH